MTSSGCKYNRKQKKRAMHAYKTNSFMQSPKATKSLLDNVVNKATEEITIFVVKFIAFIIILLFLKNYDNFNSKREFFEYIVEIFSKVK